MSVALELDSTRQKYEVSTSQQLYSLFTNTSAWQPDSLESPSPESAYYFYNVFFDKVTFKRSWISMAYGFSA